MSHSPSIQDQGDLIKTFLEINGKLRRANHDQIAELSRKSAPRFLWDGAFLQLSNSQVESLFADHRTYVYQGKEVDRQDHVGFDLSVTQQYPIEAANDGVVLLADYFGIYGNTVLIDHGCGLISLYGHQHRCSDWPASKGWRWTGGARPPEATTALCLFLLACPSTRRNGGTASGLRPRAGSAQRGSQPQRSTSRELRGARQPAALVTLTKQRIFQ
jgi:hypothetical protein